VRVGSLFSGIGGIDLGLERAGMTVIWQAETDPYASKVLAKHWPDVPNLGDVTKIDWSDVERPDVIAGGFPCQPVSSAGRRLGQADERWLWPEYARAVRDLRPDYVLVENVPGLLVRGMGDVLRDLAALGYDTEWESVPAAAVGAPHLRWRVFIVAYPGSQQHQSGRPSVGRPPASELPWAEHAGLLADPSRGRRQGDHVRAGRHAAGGSDSMLADPNGERLAERRLPVLQREGLPDTARSGGISPAARREVADSEREGRPGPVDAEPGSGRASLGRQADSVLGGRCVPERRSWWDVEPDVGRVAHGVPHRVDRLRCLGNAVVPQVAEYVGRQLAAHFDGPREGDDAAP
jgi:DNA (cytosine-5)-methyltransferase 1